jgi:uncharacterized protein YbjT (DUF2867 family)
MRVFIAGGTGTIGEAVIKELRRAGHAVTGLARSEASDAKLRALGATPHRGRARPARELSEVRRGARRALARRLRLCHGCCRN